MKYLLTLSLIFSILSCSTNDNEIPPTSNTHKNDPLAMKNIETLFDKDQFDDPKVVRLLEELHVCSTKNRVTGDYMNPDCSPRFFHVLPFIENVSMEDAFLIQVKAKTNGFPLRRLLIFVRERGELVKVNGFVANLIGTKKSKTKHNDLLLRFNDKDQGQDVFYNCLFSWNGNCYKYKSVEVIEGPGWGGAVKAELKDSISIEVEKDITKHKMIF